MANFQPRFVVLVCLCIIASLSQAVPNREDRVLMRRAAAPDIGDLVNPILYPKKDSEGPNSTMDKDSKSADTRTNGPKTAEPKTTYPKPAESKPAEPAQPKSVEPKPVEPKSTDTKPAKSDPTDSESQATHPKDKKTKTNTPNSINKPPAENSSRRRRDALPKVTFLSGTNDNAQQSKRTSQGNRRDHYRSRGYYEPYDYNQNGQHKHGHYRGYSYQRDSYYSREYGRDEDSRPQVRL